MEEIKEVFISYHEDSAGELAAKLADKLESAGVSCWYAQRDLPSGGDFANYIPPQIYGCKVFLLIVNDGANRSRHVESEVGLAFRRRNKGEEIEILPYQTEKCDFAYWLDYYLVQIQILSAETVDMSELVTEVAHKLGREPLKSGWCGPSVRWTLKDNVLTICADTDDKLPILNDDETMMGNFYLQEIPKYYNTPWWSEHEKITSVIIEHGVTSIGENAFCECKNLTSVNIAGSVSNIGNSAFAFCSNLTSVNISDLFTTSISIGENAFKECSKLTSVHIPDGVTSIGKMAFLGCGSLKRIRIPDSVASIKNWAFWACSSLKSVRVPANAKIGLLAFGPTTEVIRRPARRRKRRKA